MYWTDGLYSITVNGVPQFQDANPAAGIPNGTVWTAAWANNVTNELVNLGQRVGIAPSSTDQTQVAKAIDLTVGLGQNGQTVFGATYAMLSTDFGKFLIFTGTVAADLDLQASSAAPAAWLTPIVVLNQGSADLTIVPAAGDAVGGANTLVLAPGECMAIRPQKTSPLWTVIASTAGFTPTVGLSDFGADLVSSGYQRLPSGLILQWGSVTSGAGGQSNVVFPIPFPNACSAVTATVTGPAGSGVGDQAQTYVVTVDGFTLQTTSASGTATQNISTQYMAIGY